jgi:folate-dependent phosphoribosylglycinamide formyltransferase PurN
VDSLSERILVQEHAAYPEAVRLYAEGRLKKDGRRVLISDE